MSERYPDDAALLALTTDAHTGVEYIPTGQSPYYLEFRRLLQRLLLATARANDFRVYVDGDLSVGVRSGRCMIDNTPIDFSGLTGIAVDNNTTTWLWLDAAGDVQTSTTSLPADRTTFVPLAMITTDAGVIDEVVDLRSEALLAVASLSQLGVDATAAELNQALEGISADVDAAALNTLTAGGDSDADALHRHHQMVDDVDAESTMRLANNNAGSSANILLRFDLPAKLPTSTDLMPDLSTGYLRQRHFGQTFSLVGSTHAQYTHEGALDATQAGKLIGVVPIDGTITDVILSVGSNLDTDTPADAISASVMVNGAVVTTTNPSLSDADGAGFRSTSAGDGTTAVIKSDGTQNVSRGDVLTVDLTRAVSGSVTTDAANVVVLVVIRAARPE